MKPYICDIRGCNLRFRYGIELEEHLNLHKREEHERNKKHAENFVSNVLSKLKWPNFIFLYAFYIFDLVHNCNITN